MDYSKIPDTYQKDIEKAANLLKLEGCKAVFLFGSLATGKVRNNSDIDIGIMGLPPKKFFRVYANLDKELSNRIDLVDFDLNKDFYEMLNSIGELIEI